jgi:hypothetical protein
MQMTLEQAEARLIQLQQEALRLQGYIQALREMEAEKSAPEPAKLKAVQ